MCGTWRWVVEIGMLVLCWLVDFLGVEAVTILAPRALVATEGGRWKPGEPDGSTTRSNLSFFRPFSHSSSSEVK